MLGRLKMSTEDALKVYNSVAESIFSKKNRKSLYKGEAFKATTLENKIKDIVSEKSLGERMLDDEGGQHVAKAFVCAIPAVNMAHPRLFRTYHVRENASFDCMIWEAARATTAAPTFFKSIAIGDADRSKEDFLDAGIRYNNPADQVLNEALAIFGASARLGCLISIGTGHPGIIGLSKPDNFQRVLPLELIGVLKRIATNCEEISNTLARRFKDSKDHYFRFNVVHGAGNISLEEWKKMSDMETHTKQYLEDVDVSASINAAVRILCRSKDDYTSDVTLQSICQS